MRTIITLALKDLRLLLRDRMGLFFIAGFPVIMGLAFGAIGASFATGPSSSTAMMGIGSRHLFLSIEIC